MDHLQQKDQTEKATELLGRKKKGERKEESNGSPEIPDRGVTDDIPGLTSGSRK